ncbi:MAG: hypothetical protein L3J83_04080 [Proteobacteria bacterium]|nr:hypothetical protein [Pseudomonadota bacterium]
MNRASKLKPISIFTILFLFVLLVPSILLATIINPKTYYSANKQYSLKVIPTNKHGIGQSDIIFSKDGVLLWNKSIDSTFSDVKISKDAHIFAYSYSDGLDTGYRNKDKNNHNLTLWALSKHGKIITRDDFERGITMTHLHANDNPQALGILLQESANTVVFRFNASMHTDEDEKWIQYSIKSGKRKADLLIDLSVEQDKTYGSFHEVIALTNQDLYLLAITKLKHYYIDEYILFILLDINGQPIWSYESKNKLDPNNSQIKKYIENNPLIKYDKISKIFSITDLDKTEILSYTISKGNVTEVATKDIDLYTLDSNTTTTHKNLIEPPQFISSFIIDDRTKNNKINNKSMPQRMGVFGIDDNNNIATLYKSKNTHIFTILKPDNSIQTHFAINIDGLNKHQINSIKYKGDKKWLVLATRYDKQPILIEINSKTQTSKSIKIDAKGAIKLIIHKDKNFTVLARDGEGYLRHFNNQGEIIWTFKQESYGKPSHMSSPENITLSNDNKIIVLDNIGNKLNIYNNKGTFVSKIEFNNTENGELGYPTQLVAINDIIYVKDSEFIHKYSLSGNWLGKITLTLLNGKKIGNIADMQVTKNQHIMLSDYANVFEFDEDFKQINRFGQLPSQQLFNHIAWLDTNSQGDIYLFNDKSYSVIVFTASGESKKVFSLKPLSIPTDHVSGINIFMDDQDVVHMNLGLSHYALFDKDGQFVTIKKFDKNCSEYCITSFIAHADIDIFWQKSYDELSLSELKNHSIKTIKNITKDANGDWLTPLNQIDADSDGRLIVVTDKDPSYSKSNLSITLIDKTGKSLSTFSLEPNSSALANLTFAGDYIYLKYSQENSIRIFNFQGKQVSSLKLNASVSQCSNTLIHADSNTNKLYIYLNNTLHIYELL